MTSAWSPLPEAARPVGPQLSLEEWLALPEDEPGELVDGMLLEEEMPDAVHELAVSWLIRVVGQWLGGEGFVFGSELRFVLSAQRGRKPDVTVFLPGSAVPSRKGGLRRPPDIAIEVVSPSPKDERRDRVDKMEEYAEFGVRFYWIVDPALGSLEVFELGEHGRYTKAAAATEGVLDPVPGCAGLKLDIEALWVELARLADDE